jgi:tRNA G37 N-methylase TrmD
MWNSIALGLHAVRVDVFTIFPNLVDDFCAESLLGKARGAGLLDLRLHDLREHTTDVTPRSVAAPAW